jgi:hypothetical protein
MKYIIRMVGAVLVIGAIVLFFTGLTYSTADIETGELRDIFGRTVSDFTILGFALNSLNWAGGGWLLLDLTVLCLALYWGIRWMFWGDE